MQIHTYSCHPATSTFTVCVSWFHLDIVSLPNRHHVSASTCHLFFSYPCLYFHFLMHFAKRPFVKKVFTPTSVRITQKKQLNFSELMMKLIDFLCKSLSLKKDKNMCEKRIYELSIPSVLPKNENFALSIILIYNPREFYNM